MDATHPTSPDQPSSTDQEDGLGKDNQPPNEPGRDGETGKPLPQSRKTPESVDLLPGEEAGYGTIRADD
jgi:hypothetical protein